MRRFYENKNYRDYILDIEDEFKHDVYIALLPIMKEYSRKRGVNPLRLLKRHIEEIIYHLDDEL